MKRPRSGDCNPPFDKNIFSDIVDVDSNCCGGEKRGDRGCSTDEFGVTDGTGFPVWGTFTSADW